MGRFLFVLLLIGVGIDGWPVTADPISSIVPIREGNGIPKDISVGDKVKGKLIPKSPLKQTKTGKHVNKNIEKVISSPIKSKKRDPHSVGDFGPLPTNLYKQKNHSEGDAPPHAGDFGTVPIESGPDTRKAK